MHITRWAVGAGLLGGLAACGGGGNKVTGDFAFDIKSSHAFVVDAGSGVSVIQVLMTDKDVSCDQLVQAAAASRTAQQNGQRPPLPPFDQAVEVAFPGKATGTHQIVKPVFRFPDGGADSVPSGDAEVIWVNSIGLANIAVSGKVDVTAVSDKGTKGDFDTQSIDIFSYLEIAFNGGGHDAQGNLTWADGGVVSTKPLGGSFDADMCPGTL